MTALPRRARGSRWVALLIAGLLARAGLAQDEDPSGPPETGSDRAESRPGDGWSASATEGVRYESDDLRLHFGALVDVDYLDYDSRNVRDSGLSLDRARLRFEGETDTGLSFRIDPDYRGVDTNYGFDAAYAAWTPTRLFRLTAGLVKVPLTLEHSIPAEDMPFVGFYSFPAFLGGGTSWSVMADGEVAEGVLDYSLTYSFDGGYDLFGQPIRNPALVARLMSYPFRASEARLPLFGQSLPLPSGLFASFSYQYTSDYQRHLDVANPYRNKIFLTRDGLRADASQFLAFGWGADAGPIRFMHEFVRGSLIDLETPAGGEQSLRNQIKSWQAQLSVRIHGQPYDTRIYHQRRPMRLDRKVREDDDWILPGCLEIAARYSNADIDREFFDLGFTDYNTSSQEFRAFTGALNWYYSDNLRFTFQLVRTIADQFPAVFDSHGRDTSWVLRVQYEF